MQFVDAQCGGQLRADETSADHHGGLALCCDLPDAQIIIQAAEVTDTLKIAAGDGQPPRLAAGRQQQPAVTVTPHRLDGGQGSCIGIKPRRLYAHCQSDSMLDVERAVMEEDVLHFLLAEPELFG